VRKRSIKKDQVLYERCPFDCGRSEHCSAVFALAELDWHCPCPRETAVRDELPIRSDAGDAVAFLGMDLVGRFSATPSEEQIAQFRVEWLDRAFRGDLPIIH
jgi:hypothetical protein